ncbi:ACP S-malonyltransferase [Thalassotalea sp. M1531]|uniref:[acyl-carrier-protein] S-malonyltransferase n=1 Tax=Thalassotalea algicola TaxID=2716224 RepID=A0A7Y0L9X1_9GAMM|nr:ACP S-malonyltransferase [Thalassotalea algicola]NMP30192.1 ACP S-malonyltransferase [Thalassotalea algicola]
MSIEAKQSPLDMKNKKIKQRAVVICPGRGTYNKDELGYLKRLHGDKVELINLIDEYRAQQEQMAIAELDGMDNYTMRLHTAGENASALIYACAMADFQSINRDEYDVVAVTGNSMGWYIALAAAGVLSPVNAIELINTMGSMMTNGVIGGQLIYPVVDDNWQISKERLASVEQALLAAKQVENAEVYLSIALGGYRVFGGNQEGLSALAKALPPLDDRYPMNLFNHAAFHTPLLQDTANKAQQLLSPALFDSPSIPLIDGLGNIWQPYSTDVNKLYHYTLQTQVVEPYQFSKAVEVAIKEYAPDKLIILGPGATLGGAVAQCLVADNWQGIKDKGSFIDCQKTEPYILSMGLTEQRKRVTS